MKMENNYQALADIWREKFRNMPEKEEKAKALGIPVKNGIARINYYNRIYDLDFTTGAIIPRNGSSEVPFYDSMFVYHLFWYSVNHPSISENYVPFRDVPGAAVFDSAFKKLTLAPLAEHFNGRLSAFCKACESLNGEKLPYGDAAYSIPIWNLLKLHIIFWDGDDEFPASATLLFDKSIVEFTHVETVVTIGSDGVQAILAADDSTHQIFVNPGI